MGRKRAGRCIFSGPRPAKRAPSRKRVGWGEPGANGGELRVCFCFHSDSLHSPFLTGCAEELPPKYGKLNTANSGVRIEHGGPYFNQKAGCQISPVHVRSLRILVVLAACPNRDAPAPSEKELNSAAARPCRVITTPPFFVCDVFHDGEAFRFELGGSQFHFDCKVTAFDRQTVS